MNFPLPIHIWPISRLLSAEVLVHGGAEPLVRALVQKALLLQELQHAGRAHAVDHLQHVAVVRELDVARVQALVLQQQHLLAEHDLEEELLEALVLGWDAGDVFLIMFSPAVGNALALIFRVALVLLRINREEGSMIWGGKEQQFGMELKSGFLLVCYSP